MHLGIMAMQLDRLAPAAGVDLQAFARDFDGVALVRSLADAGFRTIELGGDMAIFFPGAFAPPAIEQLGRLKQELDLRYTVHLPLWSVEPSTPLEPVRIGSVEAVVATIRTTLPLDPAVYVLHATGALAAEFGRMRLPQPVHGGLLRLFQQQAGRSIAQILELTGIPSRRLAIETIEFPLDLTLELAEQHDLGICFDTGHVLAGFCGSVDFFEALERCLPRLAEVHLHDAPAALRTGSIGYDRDHQTLGAGDLEIRRFFDRLHEAGFDGPIVFELTIEQARQSLAAIETVRPDGGW